MQCPRCQADNRADRRFYGECGLPFASTCASCGFENESTEKFCGGCGRSLGSSPAVSTPKFASPQSYTPRHLAAKILTSKAALEGEPKQVTVLFDDLKGALATGERWTGWTTLSHPNSTRRKRAGDRARNYRQTLTHAALCYSAAKQEGFHAGRGASRKRQGPQAVCARRRAAAAGPLRQNLDLRRRPADRHPGQGPGPDRPVRLLVRSHHRHLPEPPAGAPGRPPLHRTAAGRGAAPRVRG